jgi:hypothetical protein
MIVVVGLDYGWACWPYPSFAVTGTMIVRASSRR